MVRVPGAFEMPVTVQKLAQSGKYNAIIALGAVIRGSTPHFDIVANESAKGLSAIALDHGLPVINGILTTENIEQTIERAGTKAGNNGSEAAANNSRRNPAPWQKPHASRRPCYLRASAKPPNIQDP